MKTSKTYYYWLDTIRAIAALLVLFVHARSVMFEIYVNLDQSSHNLFTQIFYSICSQGHISVAAFFILSGFLVGGINLDRLAQKSLSPKAFILNRFFRIGVPLTGAIVLIIIVDLILGNPISLISILGQYVGLQFCVGDIGGVFWTLTYEIWFYLILLAIILIYSSNKNTSIGLIIIIVFSCILIQLEISWFCIISAGIVAYRLKDIRMKKSLIIIVSGLFIISFMLYFLSTPSTHIEIFKYISASYNPFVWIVCCWSAAILISQVVKSKPKTRFGKLFDTQSRRFAAFSYSLFLTHYQLLKLYKAHFAKFSSIDTSSVMVFILVCSLCILFAWVFYLLVEKNTSVFQKYVLDKFKV